MKPLAASPKFESEKKKHPSFFRSAGFLFPQKNLFIIPITSSLTKENGTDALLKQKERTWLSILEQILILLLLRGVLEWVQEVFEQLSPEVFFARGRDFVITLGQYVCLKGSKKEPNAFHVSPLRVPANFHEQILLRNLFLLRSFGLQTIVHSLKKK